MARARVVLARAAMVVPGAPDRGNLVGRQVGRVDEVVGVLVFRGDAAKIPAVMTSDRPLPYVDPNRRRGVLYRAWVWFVPTPAGRWLSRTVAWKLDPWLLRLTRRNAVVYFNDGERVTIIASKAVAPEHPSWYFNLVADPAVVFGGRPFRAEMVEHEASRARLWTLAERVLPAFAAYRAQATTAGRTIPIIQLVPR
jgi:deazaflavin-dependent oxidoreductase (nitroreductase family)